MEFPGIRVYSPLPDEQKAEILQPLLDLPVFEQDERTGLIRENTYRCPVIYSLLHSDTRTHTLYLVAPDPEGHGTLVRIGHGNPETHEITYEEEFLTDSPDQVAKAYEGMAEGDPSSLVVRVPTAVCISTECVDTRYELGYRMTDAQKESLRPKALPYE